MVALLLALNKWYLNYKWGFVKDHFKLMDDLATTYKRWIEIDESEDDDDNEKRNAR